MLPNAHQCCRERVMQEQYKRWNRDGCGCNAAQQLLSFHQPQPAVGAGSLSVHIRGKLGALSQPEVCLPAPGRSDERRGAGGRPGSPERAVVQVRATSYTSQEPWPWNCESPKEVPKGRPKALPKSCCVEHGPSNVVWSHMWLGLQPNAISIIFYSCRVLTQDKIE